MKIQQKKRIIMKRIKTNITIINEKKDLTNVPSNPVDPLSSDRKDRIGS